MSEESQIVANDQSNNSFKSIFLSKKKSIISSVIVILLVLFSYFFYSDYKKDQKIKISEKFNFVIINFKIKNPEISISKMKEIIDTKDPTYSPLALYFLLDNNLLNNKTEVNKYFDILINDVDLDKEIKNLIIYKKGLYNSETASEEEMLNIFKPLINKDNLWRSHALYIIAEYFFSKNEMQKSKEFFEKILELKNSNPQIKLETQKRLQRDFSA